MADNNAPTSPTQPLPRVAIQFCTKCKWMLRAAYFAQELLSTFSTALGEVALIPSTGGTFTVTITTATATPAGASASAAGSTTDSSSTQPTEATPTAETPLAAVQPTNTKTTLLWDRKVDGGFPETKELKRRVRDVIEPGRDLGHVDREYGNRGEGGTSKMESTGETEATGRKMHGGDEGGSAPAPAPAADVSVVEAAVAKLVKHPRTHPHLPSVVQHESGRDGQREGSTGIGGGASLGMTRVGGLSEGSKAQIASARVNKGVSDVSTADGAALIAQFGKGGGGAGGGSSGNTGGADAAGEKAEGKEECEDCQ